MPPQAVKNTVMRVVRRVCGRKLARTSRVSRSKEKSEMALSAKLGAIPIAARIPAGSVYGILL